MTRSKKNNTYKSLSDVQRKKGNRWYEHYYSYLSMLTYQLFEWKGLPDSIDPRYMEMFIHQAGYVGFYKDPLRGFIAVNGAPSGEINHYLLPTTFHASAPNYNESFKVFNFNDLKDDDMGVIIWNNDLHMSSLPSIEMFAQDLAELKEIININQNAQKTPILLTANDINNFSIKQVYNQWEGNTPVIMVNETFDKDSIQVHKTDAPYVVDKLNDQKNAVWNEVMTYLGIKNANERTQDRVTATEVSSNDEQIMSSGNIFLKARKEACEKINLLYPELNLSVDYRSSVVQAFQENVEVGGS